MKPHQCDFCDGASQHLISGINKVYICGECIALAVARIAVVLRKEREQLNQQLKLIKLTRVGD